MRVLFPDEFFPAYRQVSPYGASVYAQASADLCLVESFGT